MTMSQGKSQREKTGHANVNRKFKKKSSKELKMSLFETVLSVPAQDLEFELRGFEPAPWTDFILNPRRLRGSDFLMRWTQGQWSEERLVQAVAKTGKFLALPYGPSGTAPDGNVREFELYFERLEKAGLGKIKRPDLLIFRKADERDVNQLIAKAGGIQELPFTREDNANMRDLLAKSILAIECENSLWRASMMPDFGTKFSSQKRLGGKPGLRKTAVLPTVIIKEEDRAPLLDWQKERGKKIHVWHVFFDLAFGIALDRAEALVKEGLIEPTAQVFQAPGGATTKKVIYKFYYQYAYPLGKTEEEPALAADHITDKNGHILPYVKFQGGRLSLSPEAARMLDQAAEAS